MIWINNDGLNNDLNNDLNQWFESMMMIWIDDDLNQLSFW